MELHIVDGTNMLHRAFHAMPPLTNSKGKPVGAIQGMMNTMLFIHKMSPKATHRVCVFDPPGGSAVRKAEFSDYKGNRTPTEDDLSKQHNPARKAVVALGWKTLEIPGVEADDVIASLCEAFRSKYGKQAKVMIHTGDKDMMQLITESGSVQVNNPIKKIIFDWDAAVEIWGVPCYRIPQVQAFIGDSIDNIPGCPGIGIKTAQKLFAEHKTLKGILEAAKSGKSAAMKKIVEHANNIKMSYKLAKLNRWLELEDAGFKWKQAKAAAIDTKSSDKFCKKWELKALGTRILTL